MTFFQDTSQLQWYNLLPLIDEAISRGKYNMVVGDAKQSIYRWRGGKAEQLIDLPHLFEPPSDILPEIEGNLITNSSINRLQVNYRSLDRIVEFNNELIGKLAEQSIPNDTIYANEYKPDAFRQKPRKNHEGGYIEINEIEKSDENNDWSHLLNQISFCKSQGYAYGDMAILVRSARKEGKFITRTLLSQNIPVISKESYDISEYQPVKIVLGLLKLSIDPNHNPSKIRVIKSFSQVLKSNVNYGKYKAGKQLDLNIFLKEQKMKPFTSFNHLSVFDAVEEIQSNYLEKLHHPALSTLKESIFNRFGLKGSIADFFEFWDNLKEKPSINFGDSGNSIELLTIHKAKGLQYKVVFLPELAWRLRSVHNELAWFSMEHHPIKLPFAPLPINNKLTELGLDQEQSDEENANRFDNLNLVYVALTRAEEALFITTYDKGKNTVGNWMVQALASLVESASIPEARIESKDGERRIIIGNPEPQRTESNESEKSNHDYPARAMHPWKENLHFANVQERVMQNIGKVFHEILSKAKDLKSFEDLLKRKLEIGSVVNEEFEQLSGFGEGLFSNQTYKELLEGGKVISERDILHEGKVIRPDLVIEKQEEQIVLDFKTGEEKNIHKEQLSEYMKACKLLKPGQVSGYLVYLSPFKFVRVDDTGSKSQMELF
jgi:ATP-dependent exoDNAse (exonuclease V) beta subunit